MRIDVPRTANGLVLVGSSLVSLSSHGTVRTVSFVVMLASLAMVFVLRRRRGAGG